MAAVPLVGADLGPGVLAGFTQRGQGGSPTPWSGWNLGLGVGDDATRVRDQRAAVARQLGVPLLFATQVHGTAVSDVDAVDVCGSEEAGTVGDADALITTRTDVGLGVLVADCVPILLADSSAGVVAVAHAGRRGLHEGIVSAVWAAMRERGASPGGTRAVIGPCVCPACYEVPEAMRAEVAARRPATWASTRAGTPSLNLAAGVDAELAQVGIHTSRWEACTVEDQRYFSHRRDGAGGAATGRFAGIVKRIAQP